MRKAEILNYWNNLPDKMPILMESVPYKHKGSTYQQDGIRLTGSKVFIDSVLTHLKPLLKHENCSTRLQLNYQESTDRESGLKTGTYNCYIQVHERGPQAQMVNNTFGVIASRGY